MSSFNKKQLDAINASPKQNILISAGAGSGKTKTLSEKVFHLVTDKGDFDIEPSELLVLTFTNNAAYEMKDRIIKRIKEDDPELAVKMASAHIQTFDSFNQTLVRKYSARLGIADQISIANDAVVDTKKLSLLDEIFDDYYKDEQKQKMLVNCLKKFNMSDDSATKAVILDIDKKLSGLLPEKKKKFINNYDEAYLSKAIFDSYIDQLVKQQKNIIIEHIYEAYFCKSHQAQIDDGNYQEIEKAFKDSTFFIQDLKGFSFEDKDIEYLYEKCLTLLDLSNDDFISAVKNFLNDGSIPARNNKKGIEKTEFATLKDMFNPSKGALIPTISLNPLNESYEQINSFKDDIHLMLEIVEELNARLDDYKRVTNTFTFSDVSNMAVSLLTDEQFEDISLEIRSQFKYIMIDEYQDTNDYQEVFIEALLKPKADGTTSHLFCVGDSKQSIYAFRNSNVELFNKRRDEYQKQDNVSKVIDMNLNYRSGERLLSDINHIFKYYMTLDHGAIDYSLEGERLAYDKDVDLFGEPFDNFGVYRIQSVSGNHGDLYEGGSAMWEAYAIANDIKTKVENGYLVYDISREKGHRVRPCQYGDFAIIMRVTKGFSLYQKIFQEHDIPLNNNLKENLRDIDSIVLIQSLISLINWMMEEQHPELIKNEEEHNRVDVKHLFASVARSYAFQYSDQEIFDLISYGYPKEGLWGNKKKEYVSKKNLGPLLENEIMKKISRFCRENYRNSFNNIFINLINEFGVVRKLYLIGNVDEAISKIESLHQIVLSQEALGEGLSDFVKLFKSLDKYSLDLATDSLVAIDNAVNLVTIHASKGLQYKIVYMPAYFNKLGKGNNHGADYDFSTDYGIILPDYTFDPNVDNHSYKTAISQLYDLNNTNKAEVDEHVRLFYVALTRAENSVIIVGDFNEISTQNFKRLKKDETILGMLLYMPHHEEFNEEYIKEKISKKQLNENLYTQYLNAVEKAKNIPEKLPKEGFSDAQYEIYNILFDEFIEEPILNDATEKSDQLKNYLFAYLYRSYLLCSIDKDITAKLYARVMLNLNAKNYNDLKYILTREWEKASASDDVEEADQNNDDMDEGDYGDYEDDSGDNALPTLYDPSLLDDNLNTFKTKMQNATEDPAYFGFPATKASKIMAIYKDTDLENVPIFLVGQHLLDFANVIDDVKWISRLSFTDGDYIDKVSIFDINEFFDNDNSQRKKPEIESKPVDDTEIIFTPRVSKRASIKHAKDEDIDITILDRGTLFHKYMELAIQNNGNTDFMSNHPEDKKIIDEVINTNPLIQLLKNAESVYSEYGYFDEDLNTTGFIDLLFVYQGEYYVIDYKLKHTSNDGYQEQLNTYRRNVQRLFNIKDTSKIRCFLISLVDNQNFEVKP